MPITQVTAELYEKADLVAKQQAEAGDDSVVSVDQMFPQVPGSCYVDILKTISDGDCIQGICLSFCGVGNHCHNRLH